MARWGLNEPASYCPISRWYCLQSENYNEISHVFFVGLFLIACQSRDHVKLIYPDKTYKHTEWTEDELKKDITVRHLHRGTHSSTHLVRIKGKESPHFHDRYDLTVSVISGTGVTHCFNSLVKTIHFSARRLVYSHL